MSRDRRRPDKNTKNTVFGREDATDQRQGAASSRIQYQPLMDPNWSALTQQSTVDDQLIPELFSEDRGNLLIPRAMTVQPTQQSTRRNRYTNIEIPLTMTPVRSNPRTNTSDVLNNFQNNTNSPSRRSSVTRNYQRNQQFNTNTGFRSNVLDQHQQKERIEKVNRLTAEIILEIHKTGEYVDPTTVERKLCERLNIQKKSEIGVNYKELVPLNNHFQRTKSVELYIKVSRETVNICTLHDLKSMVEKFMGVSDYDDLFLGRFQNNPTIHIMFEYQPLSNNAPIPAITTGQVIHYFIQFFKDRRGKTDNDFPEFLTYLAIQFKQPSPNALGLFCRSFPYLREVQAKVRRDTAHELDEAKEDAFTYLVQASKEQFEKLNKELLMEQQISAFTKKQTPIHVFNHLIKIVTKYYSFIPHQSSVYAALTLLRENDFLSLLFNLSIFLGSIEDEETLTVRLKHLFLTAYPDKKLVDFENFFINANELSRQDRKTLRSINMREKEFQKNLKETANEDNNNTNNQEKDQSEYSIRRRAKPAINLDQLCTILSEFLASETAKMSIRKLFELEKMLCENHGVQNFSELYYSTDDPNDISLIGVLHKYQEDIDPNEELIIYDEDEKSNDFDRIVSFTRQLAMHQKNADFSNNQGRIHQYAVADFEKKRTAEKWNLTEKAVKFKFGRSIDSRHKKIIADRISQESDRSEYTNLRYEESLLDEDGLNNSYVPPFSLDIDMTQLCALIANAPLMIDLSSWLNWTAFFEIKHGDIKAFLENNKSSFSKCLFFETTKNELVRLPIDADSSSFKELLMQNKIRDAVGHFCSILIQEGSVKSFSLKMYQVFIESWFNLLRAEATSNDDLNGSMIRIVEFLQYLPTLIGQSRIVETLILEPLDKIFKDELPVNMNSRSVLWSLADRKLRMKLELWAYKLEIREWKNLDKWSGKVEEDDKLSLFITKPSNTTSRISSNVENIPRRTEVSTTPGSASMVADTIADENIDCSSFSDEKLVAFEHVKRIRQNLGVDSQFDEKEKMIVGHLHGVLKRSLEKLSTDLYSEESHFVLELVQNADDNHYTCELPTLRFVVSNDDVTIYNNEIGFTSENISAICNVGASTKGKHKKGYTGHKGIGFKSVFMISHQPEIHSNNYHFRFDTISGQDHIGYILPIWVHQSEDQLQNHTEWTTCIRLPIKKEVQLDSLKEKFENIKGKLLLFLNRLRQIEIETKIGEQPTKKVFSRTDHADGSIIELEEKIGNQPKQQNLWLVVKRVFPVPEDIQNKLRDIKGAVEHTTIALAFPLDSINDTTNKHLQTQPIFAYLPLRPYGFRFILQADFEIPANRQDIRRDNLWNEWLKTQMPRLLRSAYEQFQKLPETIPEANLDRKQYSKLNHIQTIKFFLKFLPSYQEVDTYFQSFVNSGLKVLSGVIKLPVVHVLDDNMKEIRWVSPSECVLSKDQLIRKLLSEKILHKYQGRYYLHQEIADECDSKLLIDLGCHVLGADDVLQLAESAFGNPDQNYLKTDDMIKQVAEWLVCICYYIHDQNEKNTVGNASKKKNDVIERLKNMKMFPLSFEKHLVSLKDFQGKTILLPSEENNRRSKEILKLIESMPMIDQKLFDFVAKEYPLRHSDVLDLFKTMGLTDMINVRRIYNEYILPTMSDPLLWSKKSDDLLLAYLVFIFQHLYQESNIKFETEMEQLKKFMLVKNRQGKFISLGAEKTFVHLTRDYKAQQPMESLPLHQEYCHFLSSDYLTEYSDVWRSTNKKYQRLPQFLEELGISEFLQISVEKASFIQASDLRRSKWANEREAISQLVHEPFFIYDQISKEFELLMSSNPSYKLCLSLLDYLNGTYESKKNHYLATVVKARNSYDQTPIKAVRSSFLIAVQETAWIPVGDEKLVKPNEAYILPKSEESFRKFVHHVDTRFIVAANEEFFYNILGIQRRIQPRFLFELLMKWSCGLEPKQVDDLVKSQTPQNPISCPFDDEYSKIHDETIEIMSSIYYILFNNAETAKLLYEFRLWPLIFVPTDQKQGRFAFAKSLCWDSIDTMTTDSSAVDSAISVPIKKFYENNPKLKFFFIETLEVSEKLRIPDCVRILKKTLQIELRWKLISASIDLAVKIKLESELRKQLQDVAFIPILNCDGKLAKFDDKIYFPDDSDLVKLFKDSNSIIDLPPKYLSVEEQQKFFSIFDLKPFSSVILKEVKVTDPSESEEITEFYRNSIDLIQSFMFEEKLINEERSEKLGKFLEKAKFYSVSSIQVSYCYQDKIRKLTDDSSTNDTFVDEKSAKFYILEKFKNSELRVKALMGDFLLDNSSYRQKLFDFIERCQLTYQPGSVNLLDMIRMEFTTPIKPKWTIPAQKTLLFEASPTELVPEVPVTITEEEINILLNQPSSRQTENPKPDSSSVVTSFMGNKQTNQTANQTEANFIGRQPKQNANSSSPHENIQSSSEHGHTPHEDHHQASNGEKEHTPHEHHQGSNGQKEHIPHENHQQGSNGQKEHNVESENKETIIHPTHNGEIDPVRPLMPISVENSARFSSTDVESITVTELLDFDLSSFESIATNSIRIPMLDSDTDIGRIGEELIFSVLKSQQPNSKVNWINENQESMQPFDIMVESEGKQEFIEVKTTRNHQANSFFVSIGEIDFFLKHPENSSVYRVFLGEPIQKTKIVKINRVINSLQSHNLKLIMTIFSKQKH